jgi:hypothetical protein
MDRARIVHVDIETTPQGLLRATSTQERGLHVAGRTLDGLKFSVESMLRDLYLAQGHEVSVFEAEEPETASAAAWVIIPNELRKAS